MGESHSFIHHVFAGSTPQLCPLGKYSWLECLPVYKFPRHDEIFPSSNDVAMVDILS